MTSIGTGSRRWGTAKKPLDFGEDIKFSVDNGAKGKIPVFRREFQLIRRCFMHLVGLLRLIGLLNDNKAVKLLDYIHIPATFEEGNA